MVRRLDSGWVEINPKKMSVKDLKDLKGYLLNGQTKKFDSGSKSDKALGEAK